MKTPAGLANDLLNLLDLLHSAEIALQINEVSRLTAASGNTLITWSGDQSQVGGLIRSELSAISTYQNWLNHGLFSAVLYDAAILQFSYEFDGNELVKHRLAYIPCPVDIDPEIVREFGLQDAVALHLAGGVSDVRLRSPLRFDFDIEAAGDDHPASHFTMLWSHCRIPVAAALGPGHFVKFVFKNFYPHLWEAQSFLREWKTDLGNILITPEQQSLLHIGCTRPPGGGRRTC